MALVPGPARIPALTDQDLAAGALASAAGGEAAGHADALGQGKAQPFKLHRYLGHGLFEPRLACRMNLFHTVTSGCFTTME
jgi:hypothetical protein